MNGQIVLCKGVNDGEELDTTIERLADLCAPYAERVGGPRGTF